MARVEKVGASLIPEALKMRLELLSLVLNRDESSFDKLFSDKTVEFLKREDQTTVLAIDGDTVMGCATICYMELMPSFDPSEKRAYIMNVYVREEYRRRGTAREMIKFLLDEAKKRGISYVSLDATEQGRPLYKALGFNNNNENMEVTL